MAKVQKTDIQWCDYSVNPIRAVNRGTGKLGWHCERVSDGCKNCYSATLNKVYGTGLNYAVDQSQYADMYIDQKVVSSMLNFKPRGPFKNNRERPAVFPFDMTDLFGRWVPDDWIDHMMAIFAIRSDVDWLVLTKRADRLEFYQNSDPYVRIEGHIERILGARASTVDMSRLPLKNIWFGVSAEDQKALDLRWPHLYRTRAAVKFLSIEPMIGPVNLRDIGAGWDALKTIIDDAAGNMRIIKPTLDFAIVGGESGNGSRPCHVDWVRRVVQDCKKVGVRVFVKQLGSRPVEFNPPEAILLDDAKGGDMNGWSPEIRVRQILGQSVV
jgi:protein gp37